MVGRRSEEDDGEGRRRWENGLFLCFWLMRLGRGDCEGEDVGSG